MLEAKNTREKTGVRKKPETTFYENAGAANPPMRNHYQIHQENEQQSEVKLHTSLPNQRGA